MSEFLLSPARRSSRSAKDDIPTLAKAGIFGVLAAVFGALVAGLVSFAFLFRLFFAAIVFPGLVWLASNYIAQSPYLQGFGFYDLSAVGIALFALASYFPRANVTATANS